MSSIFNVQYQGQRFQLFSQPESTISELMAEIRDIVGVFPSKQQISFGVPQQILPYDAAHLDCKLSEFGLNRREMLTLTLRSDSNKQQQHRNSSLEEAIMVPIPKDNSCLFNSIAYLCEGSTNRGPELRNIVVKAIRSNKEKYNNATLGCSNDEYCSWILNQEHWGGYIEMSILSSHYGVEIAVMHIQDNQILPVNAMGFKKRIYILYNNEHYDSVVFKGFGIPEKRIVDINDDQAKALAEQFLANLNAAGSYARTKSCNIKCDVCGKIFNGYKDAQAHSEKTGHARLSEVSF